MTEPQISRRDQVINEMTGGEPKVPTPEDESRIVEEHGALEDDFEASSVIDPEDIGTSQVFESALPPEEQETTETPAEEETVQAVSTAERSAQARLREIENLRRQRREDRQRMSNMEGMLEEMRVGSQPDPSQIPDDLKDDRAAQYFHEKFEQLRKPIEGYIKSQQEGEVSAQRNVETTRYASDSASAYSQHTPDWNEAHEYARQVFAKENGITDINQLDLMEHQLVRQWIDSGQDPADAVYNYAVERGWNKENGQSAELEVPPISVPARVRRIKRGVQAGGSISAARGTSSEDRSKEMSREQFFAQTNHAERQRLFQMKDRRGRHIGQEAFDQLANTGKIDKRFFEAINSVQI